MCKYNHASDEQRVDNRGRKFCRLCRNAAVTRHYHKNKQRILPKMHKYYQDHIEEICAKARERYAADPERMSEIAGKWARDHPELAQQHKRKRNANYRARKRDLFVESVDPQVVLAMHEGVCGICQKPVDPKEFEVDHIRPLVKGGLYSYANTQPAHPFCNRSKGARV